MITNIKGSYSAKSVFIESIDDKKKSVIIRGLMLPKGKISRNGVMYEWGSIKAHNQELINKPVMYNHQIDTTMEPAGHYTDSICLESEPLSTSKWFKTWRETKSQIGQEQAGWYYEADLNPDNVYTKSVLRGDLNKVSIQLFADKAYEKEDATNGNYTLAHVGSILEGSIVPVPGFEQTSIEIAMAEAFKKEAFKNGDKVKIMKGLDKGMIGIVVDASIDPITVNVPERAAKGKNTKTDYMQRDLQKEAFRQGKINEDEKDALMKAEPKLKDEIEEAVEEFGGFPMEGFHKGLQMEIGEHPKLSPIEAGQLVLDHLKEDVNYYSKEEQMDTTNNPTRVRPLDGSGPNPICPKKKALEYIDSLTEQECESIVKEATFIQLMGNSKFKKAIEQIEEIGDSKEPRLIAIKQRLIKQLKKEFRYDYR